LRATAVSLISVAADLPLFSSLPMAAPPCAQTNKPRNKAYTPVLPAQIFMPLFFEILDKRFGYCKNTQKSNTLALSFIIYNMV
jgi:hypothetical protein